MTEPQETNYNNNDNKPEKPEKPDWMDGEGDPHNKAIKKADSFFLAQPPKISPNDLAFLKQKRESFTRVLKKLQKVKSQNSADPSFSRKISEQILELQAELDKLDQEIAMATIPDDTGATATPQQYTAEALYDSTPDEDNELLLKAGDTITNVIINRSEWWEGEINGMRGYFPRSYVRLKQDKMSPATYILGSLKGVKKWVSGKMENKPQPVGKAIALFTFEGATENELSFIVGDIITLHDMSNGLWWAGELNTKVGFFPKDYVELLEESQVEKTEGSSSAPGTPTREGSTASIGSTRRKNFDFRMSIHIVDRMKDFVNRYEKKVSASPNLAKEKEDKADKPEKSEKEKADKEKNRNEAESTNFDVNALKEEMNLLRGMLQSYEKTQSQQTEALREEVASWKKKYEEEVEKNKGLREKLAQLEKPE